MKVFREVSITSNKLDDESLIKTLDEFGAKALGWTSCPEKSAQYAKICGEPAYCVIHEFHDNPISAVHVARRSKGKFYIPNIVPLNQSELALGEYNAIASQFASDLGAYLRKCKVDVSVRLSKEDIGIAEVIPGKIPRQFFERYMSQYPRSYHPLDIQRLDKFICAFARYSRVSLGFESFERLLIEDYGWSRSDAQWCRNRVEIGINIIETYRAF